MRVRVYDNRNKLKEVKSDGKFVYNDPTKSHEYNAKYNKYINEIQPQMGEINLRGRDLQSMYEGPLNFTYQSEPIDVSRDLWSNNTITNIKRNDGTEKTLYSLKTSGVTDSDIFDNEEFYIHDTHPLAKELGIEWRDNNGNPITPNDDFLNRINNINKQYTTSQYDNGGVLDATYNEQINRIRQPRFAGWRMNGRRPIIKNRREFLDRVNNSGVNFVERMKDANREKYWFGDNNYGTHLMSWATQDGRAVVYPKIQEKNGELVYYKNDEDAIDNAIMNNDVLYMTPREARWFTKNYKKYYPEFADGGIHIKEENRGKFTQQANNAGMGVQEFAKHVLANKDNYSSTTIKRANFARNATKFNH